MSWQLNLFSSDARPTAVTALYDRAAPTPVTSVARFSTLSHLDDCDYDRLMALGATLRRRRRVQNQVLEIETRRPASLAHLRQWLTDDQALDHLSAAVGPDNRNPLLKSSTSCDGNLHRSVFLALLAKLSPPKSLGSHFVT